MYLSAEKIFLAINNLEQCYGYTYTSTLVEKYIKKTNGLSFAIEIDDLCQIWLRFDQ